MFKLLCLALVCFVTFADEIPLNLTDAQLNDPFLIAPPSTYMSTFTILNSTGPNYIFGTNHSTLVLNMSSLDAARNQFDFLVVKYFEPHCNYCIRYSPNFYHGTQELRLTNYKLNFGQIDLIANPQVRKMFGVPVCPAVQIFTRFNMGVYNFSGVYNEAGLVKWVEDFMSTMPNANKTITNSTTAAAANVTAPNATQSSN